MDARGNNSGTALFNSAIASIPSEVLVLGEGDPSAISSYGGKVQTRAGRYFTALLPVSSLSSIINEKSIQNLSYGPAVKKCLDAAVPYVSGNQTYAAGFKGDGVVIGVIDTGIDWKHSDFTSDNGLSRIVYLWDQTVPKENSSKLPEHFSYGREWTKYEIDNGSCKEDDEDGHGTHVSGIAAGNGSASGGLYKSTSPAANIIFVKADMSSESYVLDAINYIFSQAKKLNKPCVINISLGTHSGSHTENDPFNAAVDSLMESTGLQGKAIVWAAGNEATYPIHTTNKVSATADTSISFTYNASTLYADFWFPQDLTVALVAPLGYGTNISFTNTASNPVISTGDAYMTVQNAAGEKYLSLAINSAKAGDWKLVFQSNANTNTVDGYMISYSPNPSDYEHQHVFANPVPNGTISALACQKYGIAVAAMITKTSVTNQYGGPYSFGTLGDIANFSSMGPSRDNKNKPDISAPGAIIVAPLTSYYNSDIRANFSYLIVNTNYTGLLGTSMAAPMVASVVAEMLEKETYLTPDDIRSKLIANAKSSALIAKGSWNAHSGYGIADLSWLPSTDASNAMIDVMIKNNVINTGQDKDTHLDIQARCNSSQIGKTIQVKIYDKNGNLMNDFGSHRINQVEVKEYVWNGKDQFGRTVQPGLYFAFISLDGFSTRYPVLVVR